MPCSNSLNSCTHSYSIRTKISEHPDLSRSFILRSGCLKINTLLQIYSEFFCRLFNNSDKCSVIYFRHIRKSHSKIFYIRSNQRRRNKCCYLVCYSHKCTRLKVKINSSGCICKDKLFYTYHTHKSYRKNNFLHRITLIIMNSSLHDYNFMTEKFSHNKSAIMSRHCRNRKTGDILIIYINTVFKFFSKTSKTGSENNTYFRFSPGKLFIFDDPKEMRRYAHVVQEGTMQRVEYVVRTCFKTLPIAIVERIGSIFECRREGDAR